MPKALLVPAIAVLTVIGSYAIQSNIDDVFIMLGVGVIGWLLGRAGFGAAPIVLGLILGPLAEQGFVQAWMIGSASDNLPGMFFGRPISLAIIAVALITLFYPVISRRRERKTR